MKRIFSKLENNEFLMMRKRVLAIVFIGTGIVSASPLPIKGNISLQTEYQGWNGKLMNYDRSSQAVASLEIGKFGLKAGAKHHFYNIYNYPRNVWINEYGIELSYKFPFAKVFGRFTYTDGKLAQDRDWKMVGIGFEKEIRGIQTEAFLSYLKKPHLPHLTEREQLTIKGSKEFASGFRGYVRIDLTRAIYSGDTHKKGFVEVGGEKSFRLQKGIITPFASIGAGDGYEIQRGLFTDEDYGWERFTGKAGVKYTYKSLSVKAYGVYKQVSYTKERITKDGTGIGIELAVSF